MNPAEFLRWLKGRSDAMESAFIDAAGRHSQIIASAQRNAIRRRKAMRAADFHRAGLQPQALEASVRVERSKNGFVIRAGGPSTTGPDGYDHALAEEFGTRHQAAKPFFFTTARARASATRSDLENVIVKALDDD